MIDRKAIKARARDIILKEPHSPNIFLVTLICIVIVQIMSVIRNQLSEYPVINEGLVDFITTGLFERRGEFWGIFAVITVRGGIFFLAASLLSDMIMLGYTIYTLKLTRKEDGSFWTLFEGFEFIGRYILIYIMKTILIGIGLCVFIVPGIILSLMFGQTTYLLVDNPRIGPIQCMVESATMMKGFKGDFLFLQLSLLGWYIAAGLCVIFLNYFGIAIYLWIYPYTYLIFALYYSDLLLHNSPDAGNSGNEF